MPTTIDLENAKQIRRQMEVYIRMDYLDDVELAFGGYSSTAKLADGILDERDWPMRKLADLQDNGFPLDESCELYDSTVVASSANGKLGVRGNVGENVSLTVTGDDTINSLSLFVTGAGSVTYDGVTSNIAGSNAIIPIGSGSVMLEFAPSTTINRVEIAAVVSGVAMEITNESLISCVVSMRSDLSIIEPTLPESEINIEAYSDLDIGEILADIPDETPLTYQAGYDSDLSTVRNFYVSGQMTWKDNAISIHAIDAVHLLEKETVPVSVGDTDCVIDSWEYGVGLDQILRLFYYYIIDAQIPNLNYDSLPITLLIPYYHPVSAVDKGIRQKRGLVGRGHKYRDVIAEMMNIFHFDNIANKYIIRNPEIWTNFWPSYVDAGIPKLSYIKQTPKWDIYENDCGSFSEIRNRKISSITAVLHDVDSALCVDGVRGDLIDATNSIIGSFEWEKNTGGNINMNESNIFAFVIGVTKKDLEETGSNAVIPIIPVNDYGLSSVDTRMIYFSLDSRSYDFQGHYLVDSQSLYGTIPDRSSGGAGSSNLFTQFIPWDAVYRAGTVPNWRQLWMSETNAWNALVSAGFISADTTQATLNIYGFFMRETLHEQTFSGINPAGTKEKIEPLYHGHVWLTDECQADVEPYTEPTEVIEIFPDKAIKNLMNRSNITGSFTWKGDPRMQPRDVFTFHRLDGTEEECTLENITITHSGGGTSAEITYRKGVI